MLHCSPESINQMNPDVGEIGAYNTDYILSSIAGSPPLVVQDCLEKVSMTQMGLSVLTYAYIYKIRM